MSGFGDSFGAEGAAASTKPFDDGYLGYDPRLPSQRLDAFSSFTDNDSAKNAVEDSAYAELDDADVFPSQAAPDTPPPPSPPLPPVYGSSGGDFSTFSPESNGKAGFDEVFATESDGPVLPPPPEMQPEEGFMLHEWRRCDCELTIGDLSKQKLLWCSIVSAV
ncbi:hypothetical protein ACLOJK_018529 [Asimina triloba]